MTIALRFRNVGNTGTLDEIAIRRIEKGENMEKITAVNGQVMKWAREASNIPIMYVAEKFHKDPNTIADWEEGRDYPTYAQLETLGTLYKKPLAIFFFSDIPQISTIKSSYRTLPDFVYDSLSYKIMRKMNDARTLQLNLYELNNDVNPASLPLNRVQYSKDLKNMAIELRNILGVSLADQKRYKKVDDMLEIWRDRFIQHGIYVFKDAFEDDSVSGFCLYDDVFPVIYINNSMTFTRQIFTLFHEFYHIVANTSGIDKMSDDYFDNLSSEQLDIEKSCNAFAGEFLVPENDFSKEITYKAIDEFYVVELSHKYKVSREVIMRKLLDKGLISKEEYERKHDEYLTEAIRARQKKKEEGGGNPYNTRISYLGYGYLHLVFDRFAKNRIDVFQLSEYTRTRIEHLPKLEAAWGWRVSR